MNLSHTPRAMRGCAVAFFIDTASYDKAAHYPLNHGYQRRSAAVSSIVVHSTNNPRQNTAFTGEAKFLHDSSAVSAHYLVGKSGQIVQFLDPARWNAWHAGNAIAPFGNDKSIGIELHHSVGEVYPAEQFKALTWLCQQLMARFGITTERIGMHRTIALPAGRKVDPSDWSDSSFYGWRSSLVASGVATYRARYSQAIFEAPAPDAKVALGGRGVLALGEMIDIDEVKAGWAHLADHRGFVPVAVLERK